MNIRNSITRKCNKCAREFLQKVSAKARSECQKCRKDRLAEYEQLKAGTHRYSKCRRCEGQCWADRNTDDIVCSDCDMFQGHLLEDCNL